jgi:hypothetical protein
MWAVVLVVALDVVWLLNVYRNAEVPAEILNLLTEPLAYSSSVRKTR